MKTIKKKAVTFALVICLATLAAVLFAMQANKPFAASAQDFAAAESIGHDSLNEIETIAIVEEKLQEQGTSIIEELHKQRDLYLSELNIYFLLTNLIYVVKYTKL